MLAFACWITAALPVLAREARHAAYDAMVQPAGAPPVRLHVEEWGSGPPLLLLHGLGASTYTWRRIAPALGRRHRVIALDLRGFGKSDKPFDQLYGAADQARHVVDFIRRSGLGHIDLAGHSFGGAVALLVTLELNRSKPGTVRRLVVMDAPAFPQDPTAFVSFLQQPVLPYAVLTLLPPELPTSLAISNERKSGGADAEDVANYARPYYEAGARHALIATARHIVPPDWRRIVARYRSIRQPTLVVWCDHDHVVPLSTGQRLAKALPRGRLAIVRGCEHSPQDERPEALLPLLTAFLR
ncbi:MAG: alpha/beta fold hydrolase [Hyphomicrobiaceae bacterium]